MPQDKELTISEKFLLAAAQSDQPLNRQDQNGLTLAHRLAMKTDNLEIVRMLLEAGADSDKALKEATEKTVGGAENASEAVERQKHEDWLRAGMPTSTPAKIMKPLTFNKKPG